MSNIFKISVYLLHGKQIAKEQQWKRETREEPVVELSVPPRPSGCALQKLMGLPKRECGELYFQVEMTEKVAFQPSLADLGTGKKRGIINVWWFGVLACRQGCWRSWGHDSQWVPLRAWKPGWALVTFTFLGKKEPEIVQQGSKSRAVSGSIRRTVPRSFRTKVCKSFL